MGCEPLSILLVEDNEDDAYLLISRFRRAGYAVESERVQTREELEAALIKRPWDLVLSDYRLPSFSGEAALQLVKSRGLDVPFLIISGAIDDRTASAAMRAGAQDYLSKDRLDRLIPAVERELREARIRRERKVAIAAARDQEARFAALAENIPGMAFQLCRQDNGQLSFDYLSEGAQLLFGHSAHALTESDSLLLSAVLPEDRDTLLAKLADCSDRLTTLNWEGRIRVPEGDIKWINVRGTPHRLGDGSTRWDGVMWNISLSRQAQEELATSRSRLAELSSHLQRAKEQERERIARDIHDVLGGLLVGIKIELSLLASKCRSDQALNAKAGHILELADEAIATSGRVARELRPGILKEFGLAAAIESHAEDFSHRFGLPCSILCADHDIETDEDTGIAVFRIFQEALTNVLKHAQAKAVEVRLIQEEEDIVLQVSDDGIGIHRRDLAKPHSFGLRGMNERAASLGGSVTVRTQPPHGTELLLRVPRQAPDTSDHDD